VTLPGAYAPANIALEVTRALKPPHLQHVLLQGGSPWGGPLPLIHALVMTNLGPFLILLIFFLFGWFKIRYWQNNLPSQASVLASLFLKSV
jgi:hypothetical protein